MTHTERPHRGTIFAEQAVVQSVSVHPGDQYIVRLQSPRCAAAATPGSFIHLRCDDAIPMRRPLSIMRTSPSDGWVEVLFKVVGPGLEALGRKNPGDVLSSLGPIGNGFTASPDRPRIVLIGGGVGIPPMVFMAEQLAQRLEVWQPIVLMGSELPFPFELTKPEETLEWLPGEDYRALKLLEDWGIPSRLASLGGFTGVHTGYVTDLGNELLGSLGSAELRSVQLMACGPTPMLAAAAELARRYDVPCQVSLEEYMACAVGGCAGCTVEVATERGRQMRRVCVDGPVFDAAQVFA